MFVHMGWSFFVKKGGGLTTDRHKTMIDIFSLLALTKAVKYSSMDDNVWQLFHVSSRLSCQTRTNAREAGKENISSDFVCCWISTQEKDCPSWFKGKIFSLAVSLSCANVHFVKKYHEWNAWFDRLFRPQRRRCFYHQKFHHQGYWCSKFTINFEKQVSHWDNANLL